MSVMTVVHIVCNLKMFCFFSMINISICPQVKSISNVRFISFAIILII